MKGEKNVDFCMGKGVRSESRTADEAGVTHADILGKAEEEMVLGEELGN